MNYKVNKKLISFQELLFYIFWTILLVGKGIGMTSSDGLMRTMTWVAISFAGLKLTFTRWNKKELMVTAMLLSLGLCVFVSTRDAAVLLTVITIASLNRINLSKLLKYSFWLKFFFFFLVTSLAILGIIDAQQLIRYDSGDTHTIRYALGYGQPNATHYTLFVIIGLFFLSYRQLHIWHYVIWEMYNIFIYKYTNSRTGVFLTSLLIFLVWLNSTDFFYIVFRKVQGIVKYIYLIFGSVSLFIPLIVSFLYSRFSNFGTFLSRFNTATMVMNAFHINLFGNISVVTDSGYIDILYSYGIIFFVLFIFANTMMMKFFQKHVMIVEFSIIFVYSIYTIMEAYSASVLMNTSLVFMSCLLFKQTKELYITERKLASSGR